LLYSRCLEGDAKLIYKDWVYAEKKFEEIYAKVLEALAVR
jgi:hypothetical protein